MFKEVVNKKIISVLNLHTEKNGYKYGLFNSLYNENIEINSLNLSYLVQYGKDIDLSKFSGCLSQVFTVYNDQLNENSEIINLIFKKVAYYKKMNDIDTFITVLYKNKISMPEIIKK